MNFPFVKSRLRKALERGLANGKLDDELRELGELTLKSRPDGEDVCWALQRLDGNSVRVGQQTYAIARLLQEVEGRGSAAFQVLQEHGMSHLLRLFDLISSEPAEKDVDARMFLLKIFGLYGTVAGTLKIIEAARQPLKPDGFMWTVILSNFTAGHPERDLLYSSLRDPLPDGFIAVALLDAANAVLIEGNDMSHPFDSPAGKQRLREWLSSRDSDEYSYAHSATAALPFISNPERDALLDLAMGHSDKGVQIEAAWAAARLGSEGGLQSLAAHCRDFKSASTAKRYLTELGREDVIPLEANDPNFAALAEFAEWLAHPNELGRMPDALEIVDYRELRWPPEQNQKPFWLIKYTVHDTTGLEDDAVGCGLVGSVTFCLFSYELAQRPPEDAYAVHCYWEMEKEGLIEESDVQEEASEYENLLAQWNGNRLENPQLFFVAEISPELGYPQRLVGLASAQVDGEPGWVVLDGARSEWYPRTEQPPGAYESVVLKIHVGRRLLGFTGKADRKTFLAPTKAPRPSAQIIASYEKLLAEAFNADGQKQKESLSGFGPIDKHFEQYVEALKDSGRAVEIPQLVTSLSPHWDHLEGHGKLGSAAFKCGDFVLAEEFFLKYRNRCSNYERGEEMGLLAEVWCRRGKSDAARKLLIDCLVRLLDESKTATGSDKSLFEKWFQNQRTSLLKLFPIDSEALLKERAIPSSTLGQR